MQLMASYQRPSNELFGLPTLFQRPSNGGQIPFQRAFQRLPTGCVLPPHTPLRWRQCWPPMGEAALPPTPHHEGRVTPAVASTKTSFSRTAFSASRRSREGNSGRVLRHPRRSFDVGSEPGRFERQRQRSVRSEKGGSVADWINAWRTGGEIVVRCYCVSVQMESFESNLLTQGTVDPS